MPAPFDRKRLSKFLSLVLRHRPDAGGVTLDDRGFAPVDVLVAAARAKTGLDIGVDDVLALAEPPEDPTAKQRFEVEGDRIRAGHGHTVPIAGYRPLVPAAALYHATTRAAMPAIERDGLRPMARQKVHLSYDLAITIEAARRRSKDVVVVEVDVVGAAGAGVGFFESADPRIVLADAIPAAFVRAVPPRS